MTASSDITVIPTGGSTPVNLADIAASVLAIRAPEILLVSATYDSGSNEVDFYIAKQTGAIETLSFTVNGTAVAATALVTNLPDGSYGRGVAPVPSTPGTYTLAVLCSVTGATGSTSYTV